MLLLLMPPTDSNIRSSAAKFIAAGFTPVVCFIFEQHVGDSAIWLDSTPIRRETLWRVVRGLPSIFHFHQPHKRTCGSTAILEYLSAKHPCLLQDSSPGSKA
ncbi:hypothetical protein TNCV_175461 [Trichonephila clavipes]|nr:hypothetical protein TNCV_175461 [Trichonephila clavipes]